MHRLIRSALCRSLSLAFALAYSVSATAAAADAELDALNLESEQVLAPKAASDIKLSLEGALGSASQRYLSSSRNIGRASIDFSQTARIAPGVRAVISNRLDYFEPAIVGLDSTVNSLREAYISWQPHGGNAILDFGRVNLRYGSGLGYNPTDFFRDGSLRVLTTADPFALRENRMGTVMVRGQKLWSGGSLSVAVSPKLDATPSADGWNLDLGSTNNRDRVLIALGNQFGERMSSQILLYKDAEASPALGVNLTALLSAATTAHMEWTHSSEPSLMSRALGIPSASSTRNRFVGGATYTTLGKLSITAEYQYNGFGLDQSGWNALAGTPGAQLTYLGDALRRQELASRQAYLIYVTQKGLWLKDLDLAAYLRINAEDQSSMGWLELRHHWPSFDMTVQLQQSRGTRGTEFGSLVDRRVLQVLGTYYH
jgi:opacity protein-like surface antigen